jgi:hypothetical protein
VINSTVIIRLSSQGQDVRQISVEKSQDDCKPEKTHYESLKTYNALIGFKKLTPLVTKEIFGFDKQFEEAGYTRLEPSKEWKQAV